MTLQLYYTPVACSMVPYINLTEAQADFEVMPINFSKGEHMSPEYLRPVSYTHLTLPTKA